MERKLGLIDTWSTYIIQYLFVDVPSPIIKSLASFFYGNCIPVYTATQLYIACYHTCTVDATKYMFQLYLHWQPRQSVYKFHMLHYYVMLKRKHFWINSKSFFNQREEVTGNEYDSIRY